MLTDKTRLPVFLFSLFVILNSSFASGQLSLKIAGDERTGFHVDIYNGNQLLVTNTEEFSLQLFNLDLSTVAEWPHWNGQTWTGNENQHHFKKRCLYKGV